MSATGRGIERNEKDYYITPVKTIIEFLNRFEELEPISFRDFKFFDPCAGGDTVNAMSYPTALMVKGASNSNITTLDIRGDSRAVYKGDYLSKTSSTLYDAIFTNPPYNLGIEFIEKALVEVKDGGFVGMLLRLNFLASKIRREFWKDNMPKYIIVHSSRPSFTKKGTDATEYAHFVWQVGTMRNHSNLIIV